MIEIGVKGLAKKFAAESIFTDITFDIQTGQRIGMVGSNGCGKTTVFKIICGLETEDSGNISFRKGSTIGYLQQVPDEYPKLKVKEVILKAFEEQLKLKQRLNSLEKSLEDAYETQANELMVEYGELQSRFEQIGGYDIEVNLAKICSGLKIAETMQKRQFGTLSGGEKTRVMLARILLEKPDVLLLDEPTNHLDIESVEWLEDFLSEYPGAVLIISHDRFFLDRIVTQIVEIEAGKTTRYHGNYSQYHTEKERRWLVEFEDFKNIQKKIKAMKAAAERFRIWGRINTDNAAHMARAKKLEAKIEELQQIDKPKEKYKINMAFNGSGRSANNVLKAEKLSKKYGEKILFRNSDFLLKFGERICLIGPNGSGKTTWLKMAMQKELPDGGSIGLGSRVKLGLLEQEVEFEDAELSVIETLRIEFPMHEGEARNILARFLFRRDDVFKKISALSGGEKVRLRICLLMQSDVNFLMLDEPTNHLDIESREMIEEALKDFKGTILFISHDRYFINQAANSVVALENFGLKRYLGSYDYYREKRDRQTIPTKAVIRKVVNRIESEMKQGFPKQKQKKVNPFQLKKLEEEIATLETRSSVLDNQLAEYSSDYTKLLEIHSIKEQCDSKLENLLEQWEEMVEN